MAGKKVVKRTRKSSKKEKKRGEPMPCPLSEWDRSLEERVLHTVGALTRFVGRPVSFDEIYRAVEKKKIGGMLPFQEHSLKEIVEVLMTGRQAQFYFGPFNWKGANDV